MNLAAQAAKVELLLLDVDGVLTDGRLHYSEEGVESKIFHVRDGSGIKLWQGIGRRIAIISGRNSKGVEKRAKELAIDIVRQGQHPKDTAYREVLALTGLASSQVCCVGDDLMDLPLMMASGLSVAVGDAVPEVKEVASHVTIAVGGHGAVRETIEWLLKLQGVWEDAIRNFRRPAC